MQGTCTLCELRWSTDAADSALALHLCDAPVAGNAAALALGPVQVRRVRSIKRCGITAAPGAITRAKDRGMHSACPANKAQSSASARWRQGDG